MGVAGSAGAPAHLLPLLPRRQRNRLLRPLLETALETLQSLGAQGLLQLLDHPVEHPIAVVAEGLEHLLRQRGGVGLCRLDDPAQLAYRPAEPITDQATAVIAATEHVVAQLQELLKQLPGSQRLGLGDGSGEARRDRQGPEQTPGHASRSGRHGAIRQRMSGFPVANVERGKPGTSMAAYLAALWVLGLLDQLAEAADPDRDAEGKASEAGRQPGQAPRRRRLDDDF
jgi:hypothetical protein